jgi:hypothetical protein
MPTETETENSSFSDSIIQNRSKIEINTSTNLFFFLYIILHYINRNSLWFTVYCGTCKREEIFIVMLLVGDAADAEKAGRSVAHAKTN